VWRSEIDGLRLTFHLAGINNQNFLMRDEQTGTFWQQISGRAISGPLAGRSLVLVPSDELSFALWKAEEPQGRVADDVAAYVPEYAARDWDVRMRKAPTVLNYREHGMEPRDLMLGLEAFGASRAILYDTVLKEKLVMDHVGMEPVMFSLGPDEVSVRVFRRRIQGIDPAPQFYRTAPESAALFLDDATGSGWNFQGCAVSGKLQGICLERVEAIKDYWFDWRHYHPDTSIYSTPPVR
jgi:Protein of unknown function (DUF3179)